MKIFLFASVALGLTSCLNTPASVCENTVLEPVQTASGPKSVAVNQPATFALAYQLQGPCGKFSSVSEAIGTNPNIRIVGVKVSYTGCSCPQTSIPSQASYTFQPTQAGTYYLNFVVDNGYLTDTLVVK